MSDIIDSPINRTSIDELSMDVLDRMLTELRDKRTRLRVRMESVAVVSNDTPQVRREQYMKLYDKISQRFTKLDETIDKLTEDVNKLRIKHMEIN